MSGKWISLISLSRKCLMTTIVLFCAYILPVQDVYARETNLCNDFQSDITYYFETDNLINLGEFFAVGAVFANTNLDSYVRNRWQSSIRSRSLDRILTVPNAFAEYSVFYFPIYVVTAMIGQWFPNNLDAIDAYEWGYQSARTFVLGGIQQAVFTNLLGSGRPYLGQSSRWTPFRYKFGVSGHAMYGAIPLLTIANMSDTPIIKGLMYFLSALPAISRINNDKHYFSQAFLGWSIAFLTSRSVARTNLSDAEYNVFVGPTPDNGVRLLVVAKF